MPKVLDRLNALVEEERRNTQRAWNLRNEIKSALRSLPILCIACKRESRLSSFWLVRAWFKKKGKPWKWDFSESYLWCPECRAENPIRSHPANEKIFMARLYDWHEIVALRRDTHGDRSPGWEKRPLPKSLKSRI